MNNDKTVNPQPATRFQYLSLFFALAFISYGFFAQPPNNLTREGLLTLTVFGFSLLLWQSKVIPHVATSLLAVGFLYGFGIAPTFQAATIGFASTLFFFFLTILILGHSIAKVNLDRRVAYRVLASSSTPKTTLRQLGKYVLALALIMPSGLARMVAFTPIVNEVRDIYGLDRSSPFITSSFLLLGQLNPIASMALMTGGALPIIGAELMQTAGYPIDWLGWAVYMIPPVLLIYILGFYAVERLHTPSLKASQTNAGEMNPTVVSDSLSREQYIVGVVMCATLLAWATGSLVGLPTVLPAILAVGVLSAPRVRVLMVEDLTNVNWGILFIIGAMLSLIEGLEATGAFTWLIAGISSIIPFDTYSAMIMITVLFSLLIVMRLLFPNGSTCLIVMLPVMISFGQTYDLNVLYISLSTVLLVGSTVLLPVHLPPALLAHNGGYVEIRHIFVYGLSTLGFALISVSLAWTVYWPFLESIVFS